MSDSVFVDTNILVYSYSATEEAKRLVSRKIISNNITVVSTQVLQELSNVLHRKFGKSWQQIQLVLTEIGENNSVFTNNIATINRACKMAEAYGYSFYDSLIIAAAMESGCNILYSEDMQDGHIIEERLTITNPFKG
ncbi:MAG: hypothetical protein BGO69_13865 [Bacteroidetes bacterium 46-16]|nr:MAG: hypothetical protein BGO69_13865 [Bacteroidetes bacterium 46-16]